MWENRITKNAALNLTGVDAGLTLDDDDYGQVDDNDRDYVQIWTGEWMPVLKSQVKL